MSQIAVGTDVDKMIADFKANSMFPQQISSYMNSAGQRQYVVLWTNTIIDRYPQPSPLWQATAIPVNYYRKSNEGFPKSKMNFVEDKVRKFMMRYNIPAVSLAVSYNESLKLAFGMGLADTRTGRQATAESCYRVASISKPITAAAIFKLVEAGSLHLDSPVFGTAGILGKNLTKFEKHSIVEKVAVKNNI